MRRAAVRVIVGMLLFPVLLVVPANVSAVTYVSGVTMGVWTTANSPYIVTDDIFVPTGESLTINPRVVVRFDDDKSLYVDGALIAEGTPGEPVVFTSNSSLPDRLSWRVIQFNETSDEMTSRIGHARIEYAYEAILLRNTSIPIENVTFYRNFRGIMTVASHTIIRNNFFEDNWYGLTCEYGCHAEIKNNTFAGTVDTAIFVWNATSEIVNNTIEDGDIGIRLEEASADTRSNWIENCSESAILLSDQSSANASSLRLSSSRRGVWSVDSSFTARGITIDNSESGLFLVSSSVHMEDANIYDSSLYGIWMLNNPSGHANPSVISLWNSSIVDSDIADLRLGNDSLADFFGTGFNRTSVVFDNENSTLGVHWFLRARVEDTKGWAISGAMLNVWDNENGTLHMELETNEIGEIPQPALLEYEQGYSTFMSYSPYRILATKQGYEDNETYVDLSNNVFLVIQQRMLNNPPSVLLNHPIGGEEFTVGSELIVEWTAQDDHTPFANLTFYVNYTCQDCGDGEIVGPLVGVEAYAWTIPNGFAGKNISVSIVVIDEDGLTQSNQSDWFHIAEPSQQTDYSWVIIGILAVVGVAVLVVFFIRRREEKGDEEG